MSSKRSLASGAPACSCPSLTLISVGALLLTSVILFSVTAAHISDEQHAFGVVVAAAVIVSLLFVGACFSGCRLWLEREPVRDTDDVAPGPVSPWRLGCFGVAAMLATVALVLAFVGLGYLGTTHGAYIAGVVVTTLAWVVIVAIGVYFCYEVAR